MLEPGVDDVLQGIEFPRLCIFGVVARDRSGQILGGFDCGRQRLDDGIPPRFNPSSRFFREKKEVLGCKRELHEVGFPNVALVDKLLSIFCRKALSAPLNHLKILVRFFCFLFFIIICYASLASYLSFIAIIIIIIIVVVVVIFFFALSRKDRNKYCPEINTVQSY